LGKERKGCSASFDQSDARFLLARLRLDYVLKWKVNPTKMWKALESLPEDLNAAYDDVMDRIAEKDPEKNAFAVLSWIYRARRPLTMNELREALSISPGQKTFNDTLLPDAQKLIEICEGLVLCGPDGIVQFAHFTVQEYLHLHCNSKLLPEAELAKTCLTYLGFEEFDRIYDGDIAWRASSFGRYAMYHWVKHTRGEAEKEHEVQKAFLSLFENEKTTNQRLLRSRRSHGYLYDADKTLLHVSAVCGLATLCRLSLEQSFSQK
jgi:hypothetical protein